MYYLERKMWSSVFIYYGISKTEDRLSRAVTTLYFIIINLKGYAKTSFRTLYSLFWGRP